MNYELITMNYITHGIEFDLRFLPFLLFLTVFQNTTTGIQPVAVSENLHTSKSHKKVGLSLHL